MGRVFLLPRVLWGHKVVAGLHRNGCITKSKFKDAAAHAHQGGRFDGWICVAPGEPLAAQLLLHELAHLKCAPGHTKAWRRHFLELAAQHSPEMVDAVLVEIEEFHPHLHRRG